MLSAKTNSLISNKLAVFDHKTVLMKKFILVLIMMLGSVPMAMAQRLLIGDKVPDLKSTTWVDGRKPSGDKPIFIDFFMSESETCMKLLPKFEALYNKYKDRIDFVLITKESNNEIIRAIGSKDYFIAIDTKGNIYTKLAVEFLPYSIFVSSGGKLMWQGNLANLREETLQKDK